MELTGNQIHQHLASPYLVSWLPVVVALVSPFLLTYAYTSIQYLYARYSDSPKPPTPPYFVPFLGHTIPFAFDTDRYLRTLRSRFGSSPIRLLVGTDVFSFVPHGETVQMLFKSREVNSKIIAMRSMGDMFDHPEEDLKLWAADGSGTQQIPEPGFEDWPSGKRAWFSMHRVLHGLLQGEGLKPILSHFIQNYTALVESQDIGFDEWTTIDDLYGKMRNDLFHAAMQALCGDHFFQVAPTMAEDFWEFDRLVPAIFKKVPRWLIPSNYAARDKVIGNLKKWLDYADEHFDWTNEELVNCSWEPIYGAKIMRARQKVYHDMGQRREAGPASELGLIWATNSNVIPTAFWTVLGVLKSDNLRARVVAEIDECFVGNTVHAAAEKLTRGNLAMSMYHESLRYAVSVMTVRCPNYDGFRIGKWLFNKKDILLTSSWAGHRDETFWNTGRILPDGKPEHPVDTWWAERFLEYPDDAASGPIRKPDPEIYRNATAPKRTPEDDKRASLTTSGTSGHSFPYGGGLKMCPGRFFAKSEMIVGAAMLLRFYEIELVDPVAASKVGPNMNFFPFGALPPDRKVAVRIRRRKL